MLELELWDEMKHTNPYEGLNVMAKERGLDYFRRPPRASYEVDGGKMRIKDLKEKDFISYFNHEFMHHVLFLIEGEEPCNQYDKIQYYVDWVHNEQVLNGEKIWERIINSRMDCPRCDGEAELVDLKNDIYNCKKCGFLYDDELLKNWYEIIELNKKAGFDPNEFSYFKKIGDS